MHAQFFLQTHFQGKSKEKKKKNTRPTAPEIKQEQIYDYMHIYRSIRSKYLLINN